LIHISICLTFRHSLQQLLLSWDIKMLQNKPLKERLNSLTTWSNTAKAILWLKSTLSESSISYKMTKLSMIGTLRITLIDFLTTNFQIGAQKNIKELELKLTPQE